MNISIGLALAAMAIGAATDVIFKVVQRKGIVPTTFMFYQSLVFTVVIVLVSYMAGELGNTVPATWLYGLPGGIMGYYAFLFFLQSLKDGDASVNSPIFRLNFIVTSLGAFLVLHEPITTGKSVGILLATFSVMSMANLAGLIRGRISRRSLILVLLGTFLFGIFGLFSKLALNAGSSALALIPVTNITFMGSAFLTAAFAKGLRPNKPTLRFAPPVAIIQVVYAVALVQSLQMGDASVTFPITQLSFVLTAIMAIFILKEAATRAKYVGLGLAVAAVIAFAL